MVYNDSPKTIMSDRKLWHAKVHKSITGGRVKRGHSLIPSAGQGLFAVEPIGVLQEICPYAERALVTARKPTRLSMYVVEFRVGTGAGASTRYVDSADPASGYGRSANDPLG